mgnify:FL=1
MIFAVFSRKGNRVTEVSVSGHAGYAPKGEDIVCASVTSALQTVINGITEVLKVPAQVQVEENKITCTLPEDSDSQAAQAFLNALFLQLNLLAEDYPKTITLKNLEV